MANDISIVITAYNDDTYLDLLFQNISELEIKKNNLEILFLDASNYTLERAKKHLKKYGNFLSYFSYPGLSRESSLNKLFKKAKGDYIFRLDSRTKVNKNYLLDLISHLKNKNLAVAGGLIKSISLSPQQDLIANMMNHPMAFGFASFRTTRKPIFVDSVYLGAFKRDKCLEIIGESDWFETSFPIISEDSELNYRLRKGGGKILCDPSIISFHYPRESLIGYLKLCENYGRGKAYFFIKHFRFTAIRQIVAISLPLIQVILLTLSIYKSSFIYFFLVPIIFYYTLITIKVEIKTKFSKKLKIITGISLGHFAWFFGFYKTLGYHLWSKI